MHEAFAFLPRASAGANGRSGKLPNRMNENIKANSDGSQWTVVVEGRPQDLAAVACAIKSNKVSLDESEKDGWLLTADVIADLDEARAVKDMVAEILDTMVGAVALGSRHVRPLTTAHVYRRHPDGRKDVFVMIGSAVEVSSAFGVGVTQTTSEGVVLPSPPSKAEKAMTAAEADHNLRRALRIFSQCPRTIGKLYKIYELTQQHLKSDSWSSSRQRGRFTHSANHPEAHGEDARHAVSNQQPPADPMSLSDSEYFIGEILERWVDEVWGGLQGDG